MASISDIASENFKTIAPTVERALDPFLQDIKDEKDFEKQKATLGLQSDADLKHAKTMAEFNLGLDDKRATAKFERDRLFDASSLHGISHTLPPEDFRSEMVKRKEVYETDIDGLLNRFAEASNIDRAAFTQAYREVMSGQIAGVAPDAKNLNELIATRMGLNPAAINPAKFELLTGQLGSLREKLTSANSFLGTTSDFVTPIPQHPTKGRGAVDQGVLDDYEHLLVTDPERAAKLKASYGSAWPAGSEGATGDPVIEASRTADTAELTKAGLPPEVAARRALERNQRPMPKSPASGLGLEGEDKILVRQSLTKEAVPIAKDNLKYELNDYHSETDPSKRRQIARGIREAVRGYAEQLGIKVTEFRPVSSSSYNSAFGLGTAQKSMFTPEYLAFEDEVLGTATPLVTEESSQFSDLSPAQQSAVISAGEPALPPPALPPSAQIPFIPRQDLITPPHPSRSGPRPPAVPVDLPL